MIGSPSDVLCRQHVRKMMPSLSTTSPARTAMGQEDTGPSCTQEQNSPRWPHGSATAGSSSRKLSSYALPAKPAGSCFGSTYVTQSFGRETTKSLVHRGEQADDPDVLSLVKHVQHPDTILAGAPRKMGHGQPIQDEDHRGRIDDNRSHWPSPRAFIGDKTTHPVRQVTHPRRGLKARCLFENQRA